MNGTGAGPLRRAVAFAVVLLLTAPAAARDGRLTTGRLSTGDPIDVSVGRIVVAFIFVVVIAGLAALLIRQRSGKIDLATLFSRVELRRRAIHVVETRRLSPHADICVVRHEGREYLLLLQAGNARVLREESFAEPSFAEAGARLA